MENTENTEEKTENTKENGVKLDIDFNKVCFLLLVAHFSFLLF